MELEASHTYAVPVSAVVAVLSDPAAVIAKYESMKQRDVKVLDCKVSDGTLRVTSSRVVDVDLPGFARRVLKPTNTLRQTDVWTSGDDGSWEGTVDVDVQGAPIHISGTMRLIPHDAQTVHEISLRVDVRLPLIGGRVAKWVTDGEVSRSLEAESGFYDSWLREHPSGSSP